MKRSFLLFLLIFCFPYLLRGEEWSYVIKWMGVIAGTFRIEIKREDKLAKLRGELRTRGIYYLLYPVRDILFSEWDIEKERLRFVRMSIREGRYGRKEEKYFEKEEGFVDPLTFFYLLGKVREGEKTFAVYAQGKTKEVRVRSVGKEDLKIYSDKFSTIKLLPVWESKGLKGLARRIKKLELWVEEKKGIPLLIEAKTKWGPVTVLLRNRKELLHDRVGED